MTPETKKSLLAGIESLKNWYSVFGVLVASVAVANFCFSLFNIKAALLVSALLSTYRAIVHGAIDWVLFLPGWHLPGYAKDLAFFYAILGGAFMRARASTNKGRYYESLYDALRILIAPSKRARDGSIPAASRLTAMYWFAPPWFRRIFDFFFWPRVAHQYFDLPIVRYNDYTAREQFFEVDYKSNKPFLYDRRVLFLIQLLAVSAAFFGILVTNAFLTIPVQ